VTTTGDARELMDIVTAPSALVAGTFLAFANRALQDNRIRVDHVRIAFAVGASVAAVGVTAALVAVMSPLAVRSVWTYRGDVEATLTVYWMIFLSVTGTCAYALWTALRCVREPRRPSR
jgi:hypothetical protein